MSSVTVWLQCMPPSELVGERVILCKPLGPVDMAACPSDAWG